MLNSSYQADPIIVGSKAPSVHEKAHQYMSQTQLSQKQGQLPFSQTFLSTLNHKSSH